MRNLGTIRETDQEFGNEWITDLRFKDGTHDWRRGERPIQFSGVHGLVNEFGDEFHIMGEDDGHFWTTVIVSEVEVRKIHKSLVKLLPHFQFKNNFKVTFDTHIQMDRKISEDINFKINPRGEVAPLIEMNIKGKKTTFDVNWLESFIEVLDIDTPIK